MSVIIRQIQLLAVFGALAAMYSVRAHGDHDVHVEEIPWLSAVLATLLISIGGNVAIFLLFNFKLTKERINVMLGFAMGGLLGDAFLHLIPHALEHGEEEAHHHEEEDHHHHHDTEIGLSVLAGIFVFFAFEKYLRRLHKHSHGHSHVGHSDGTPKKTPKKKKSSASEPIAKRTRSSRKRSLSVRRRTRRKKHECAKNRSIDMAGVQLNIVADSLHNFTDGMAIAAAFLTSRAMGISVTLAILLHEIPHEMGDFAVLISHGFNKREAFFSQFYSAAGAFLGCAVGLCMPAMGASGNFPTSNTLAFTAGGFVYVALLEISPKLMAKDASAAQCGLELCAAACGVGMMLVVGAFEEG
eukprot:g1500.t1